MKSIYMHAMGESFTALHPRIRERFGFSSMDRVASIGKGTMDLVWHAKWATLPLYAGTLRHIMFPQSGRDIPFTIENYAYVDRFGRETVTWIRKFKFPRGIRRFDATMVYCEQRSCIVDYLGNRQHLAVDLELDAAPGGGVQIHSGEQRFYEGKVGFKVPALLTGQAAVREEYDDEIGKYRIQVQVTHPLLGPIFKYAGTFEACLIAMPAAAIPLDALPVRDEARS